MATRIGDDSMVYESVDFGDLRMRLIKICSLGFGGLLIWEFWDFECFNIFFVHSSVDFMWITLNNFFT